MRVNKTYLCLAVLPALTLTACAVNDQAANTSLSATPATSTAHAIPGGTAHWGSSIATMADQYNRPHAGAVAAAGASAWVAPAPAPAMVVTDLPPAAPPAPPPAAVANRQPAPAAPASPAVDAANIVRPEAGGDVPAPAAAAPALSDATRKAGRDLFNQYTCGACHTLADAGTSGSIGPGLDRNSRLSKDYVADTVKTGRGAMPSFAGQMSDAEIATLAEYIVGVSRK